jgi:hypothetical protein
MRSALLLLALLAPLTSRAQGAFAPLSHPAGTGAVPQAPHPALTLGGVIGGGLLGTAAGALLGGFTGREVDRRFDLSPADVSGIRGAVGGGALGAGLGLAGGLLGSAALLGVRERSTWTALGAVGGLGVGLGTAVLTGPPDQRPGLSTLGVAGLIAFPLLGGALGWALAPPEVPVLEPRPAVTSLGLAPVPGGGALLGMSGRF